LELHGIFVDEAITIIIITITGLWFIEDLALAICHGAVDTFHDTHFTLGDVIKDNIIRAGPTIYGVDVVCLSITIVVNPVADFGMVWVDCGIGVIAIVWMEARTKRVDPILILVPRQTVVNEAVAVVILVVALFEDWLCISLANYI
jgi:hypothetical protein